MFGKLFLIKSSASKLVLATLYLLKSAGLEAPIKTWSLKIVTSPPSIFDTELIFKTFSGLIWFRICLMAGISLDLFVSSLISFNVGVELGQISVIILSYILIALLFQKKLWYRSRVTSPISVVVAFIGFYWFVQRLFF